MTDRKDGWLKIDEINDLNGMSMRTIWETAATIVHPSDITTTSPATHTHSVYPVTRTVYGTGGSGGGYITPHDQYETRIEYDPSRLGHRTTVTDRSSGQIIWDDFVTDEHQQRLDKYQNLLKLHEAIQSDTNACLENERLKREVADLKNQILALQGDLAALVEYYGDSDDDLYVMIDGEKHLKSDLGKERSVWR